MKFHFYVGLLIAVCSFSCINGQNKQLSEAERFRLAAEYNKNTGGLSMLVLKGGKIVFEEYQNGFSAAKPWILASGTKSFSGAMLAAAIEDKLIQNFDEKVSETIIEWKSDPQKSKITLRQLLSLTSGLDAGQSGAVIEYADAINAAVKYPPGTHFQYGPIPYQIFGEVLKRKLAPRKETVFDYLKRRILNPIDLKVAFWRTTGGGDLLLPQGAILTAREWAKFGEFIKNGGKWNGKQIISKNLLDELIVGSQANPTYGMTFWLNQAAKNPSGKPNRPRNDIEEIIENGISADVKDVFMAAGAGNQRLYIIRSLGLVVVRQSRQSEFEDQEFLSRLLAGKASN